MKLYFAIASMFISAAGIAAQTPNGTYAVDTDHAHIGFSVSHLGFSNVIGRFNEFEGLAVFEADGDSSVNFTIQAASVDTNQERRDRHVRSADFFDVATFPTISFRSTEITYTEEGDPATITGDLDFHGVINSVTFNVSTVGAGEFRGETRAGYQAVGNINRSEFDMDSFSGVVGEVITVTINLELIKQ